MSGSDFAAADGAGELATVVAGAAAGALAVADDGADGEPNTPAYADPAANIAAIISVVFIASPLALTERVFVLLGVHAGVLLRVHISDDRLHFTLKVGHVQLALSACEVCFRLSVRLLPALILPVRAVFHLDSPFLMRLKWLAG